MKDLDKNLDTEDFEPRVYEIGYHIVPTVAEDSISSAVDTIRKSIEETQGIVISQDIPKSVDLAYSMDHIVSNKKTIFDTAYFGWIKFEGDPKNILEIKDSLDKNEEVLRFIIIKTVKEDTIAKKTVVKEKEVVETKTKKTPVKKEVEDIKEKTEKKKEVVDEKEVDKAIEELVA